MNSAYEEFTAGSQSPFNVSRGAHPGAVLLSPQSSAMNLSNSVASGGGVLSPQMSAHSQSLSFNEMMEQSLILDGNGRQQSQHQQQSLHLQNSQATLDQPTAISSSHSAAGSAVLPPMVQSPNRSPANSSMFLDSFPRQASNAALMVHSRTHSSHKSQSQSQVPAHKQSSQQQQPQQQPQHTESNPVVNFTQDINQLCSWMSMLSSSQQNTVMDNLLSTLNEDVLRYTKLKLDSLMNSGYLSPKIPAIASPIPNRDNYAVTNLDSVFSNGETERHDSDNIEPMLNTSIIYQQWSPPPTSVTQPIYDYINDMHHRPKSADPNVSRNNSIQKGKRSNNNVNVAGNNQSSHSYSGHNSHYASSKNRNFSHDYDGNNVNSNSNSGTNTYYNIRQPNNYNHTSNHNYNYNHATSNNNAHTQMNNPLPASVNTPLSPSGESSPDSVTHASANTNSSNQFASTASSTASTPVSNGHSSSANGSSMNPRTLTDPRLLTNIPVWLKSLRLHKYSEALGNKKWEELICLDDQTLEKIGISALGARRKLLKAFTIVQEYKAQGLIDESAYT